MEPQLHQKDLEAAKKAGIRFYASPGEKEQAYLQEALARTDKERFQFLMNLMRLERVMRKANLHPK